MDIVNVVKKSYTAQKKYLKNKLNNDPAFYKSFYENKKNIHLDKMKNNIEYSAHHKEYMREYMKKLYYKKKDTLQPIPQETAFINEILNEIE